jgi:hypothetical protein
MQARFGLYIAWEWGFKRRQPEFLLYHKKKRTVQIEGYRERRIMVTQTVFHQDKLQSLTESFFRATLDSKMHITPVGSL